MAMKTITIKSVPEELYKKLRLSAAQHRRSINSEAIVCLEQYLKSSKLNPSDFLAKIDALRSEAALPPLTDQILSKTKSSGRP